jgi:two-component system, LytTR family, response regulator
MIRVFLVEDEPPALRKLERMLGTQPDFAICGTASTYVDAVTGIVETKPDLLILDIRLPDGTGFEILQTVNDPGSFQIIFLTAHDEFALAAFEAAALDYLVKPVTQERFAEAMQRVRQRVSRPALKEPPPRYTKRFLVERLKALCLVPVESIDWIAADRNYALLYGSMGEFALRTTMDTLEQKLDPALFVRVSRSAIVRIDAIREVHDQRLRLHSGAEVDCSRKYWAVALARLQ